MQTNPEKLAIAPGGVIFFVKIARSKKCFVSLPFLLVAC